MSPKSILKYTVLALFTLNLPTAGLNIFGGAVGAILSSASFGLLIVYYLFFLKGKPNIGLLYCGVLYFTFAGFQILGDDTKFITNLAKFLIVVIFGNSFFKEISKKEMTVMFVIGAITIVMNALVFASDRGRSGGFYLNPNAAGFVVLFAYAFTFGLKAGKRKSFLMLLFTIAGFLTFSRTFIIMWVCINLISLLFNRKNIRILVIGVGLFLAMLIVGEALNLGGVRFEKYKGVLNNETTSSDLSHDSRTHTWSLFYDEVTNSPFIGGGYGKFQIGGVKGVGVHNTYLLIIGEAGIVPFLAFLIFILILYKKSIAVFKTEPSLFLMCFVFTVYLLTTHNYFDNEVKVVLSLYMMNQIHILYARRNQKLSPGVILTN